MVPRKGLEPSHLTVPASKTGASTNSAIWAGFATSLVNLFTPKMATQSFTKCLLMFALFLSNAKTLATDSICSESLSKILTARTLSAKDFQKIESLGTEYKTLWAKPLSSYLDESAKLSLADGSTFNRLVMSEESVEKLWKDMDRLSTIRESIEGFSIEFRPWWKAHREFYLRSGWIQTILAKSDLTLSDFHMEMMLQFASQPNHIKKPGWTKKILSRLKPRYLASGIFVGTVFVLKEFKNVAVIGTGVQTYNGYMSTLNSQIVNKAQQLGAEWNAPIAEWLSVRLTNGPKIIDLKEKIKAEVDAAAKVNYENMSPAQAQKEWEKVEHRIFALYQELQIVLPSHLREVRYHYRDVALETPLKYRAYIASFYNQHQMASAELERLSKDPQANKEQIAYHQGNLKSAQNSIAATLASWRVTSYLYKEFTGTESTGERDMLNAYKTMSDFLGFNLYVQNYRDQSNMLLQHLGFEVLSFDVTAVEHSQQK